MKFFIFILTWKKCSLGRFHLSVIKFPGKFAERHGGKETLAPHPPTPPRGKELSCKFPHPQREQVGRIVGRDPFGNIYYELPAQPELGKRKPTR